VQFWIFDTLLIITPYKFCCHYHSHSDFWPPNFQIRHRLCVLADALQFSRKLLTTRQFLFYFPTTLQSSSKKKNSYRPFLKLPLNTYTPLSPLKFTYFLKLHICRRTCTLKLAWPRSLQYTGQPRPAIKISKFQTPKIKIRVSSPSTVSSLLENSKKFGAETIRGSWE